MGFPDARTARHHPDFVLLDLALDRSRTLVGQERHTAHGICQAVAFELDVLVVAFRDDAFVCRKLTIDHPRNEESATHLEKQVVFAALVPDVSLALGQETTEFAERFLRKDWPIFVSVLPLTVTRGGHESQTMAV